MTTFFKPDVGIVSSSTSTYPKIPPFHPDKIYPESPSFCTEVDSENKVYKQIRELFKTLKLDIKNYGNANWNPLSEIIKPGDTVCLKPNFVMHYNWGGHDVFSVITHGSIIRAVIDYIVIALEGKGKIIVGDAPQADADFSKIIEKTGMKEIAKFIQSKSDITIEIIDFRKKLDVLHEGVCIKEKVVNNDPRGYFSVNLGNDSLLSTKKKHLFYGSDYNREKTIKHHSDGKHQYIVSASVLSADVIISLPKLKTHKKAGVTLNMKNMIGINGDKNFIPHYCVGDPHSGGDEFPTQGTKFDRIRYQIIRKIMDLLLGKFGWILALPISYIVKFYKIIKTGNVRLKSRQKGFSIAELFWKSFLKKRL